MDASTNRINSPYAVQPPTLPAGAQRDQQIEGTEKTSIGQRPSSAAPTVASFVREFQHPGLPALPADLDRPIFSACTLETICRVKQLSRGGRDAVAAFIAAEDGPRSLKHAAQAQANVMRRKDVLDRTMSKMANARLYAQSSSQPENWIHSFQIGWSNAYFCMNWFSPDTWTFFDKALIAANSNIDGQDRKPETAALHLHHRWAENVLYFPRIVEAVTSPGRFRELSIDLRHADSGAFLTHILPALQAIDHRAAPDFELCLLIGEKLNVEACKALVTYLKKAPYCLDLKIDRGPANLEAASLLYKNLATTHIKQLSVSACSGIAVHHQEVLAQLLDPCRLDSLEISQGAWNAPGSAALIKQMKKNSTLKSLTLHYTGIASESLEKLFGIIGNHPSLLRLQLSGVANDDGKVLAESLAQNQRLQEIVIDQCEFTQETFAIVFNALADNHYLTHVRTCSIPVNDDTMPALNKLVSGGNLRELAGCYFEDVHSVPAFIDVLEKTNARLTVRCFGAVPAMTQLEQAVLRNSLVEIRTPAV